MGLPEEKREPKTRNKKGKPKTMPDDKSLLESLTNATLPALPSSEPAPEPTEPTKEVTTEERGKSPEEVVEARETRLPADKEERAPAPTKPEEKKYLVRGVEYSAKELEAAGLLEDLAVTHSKYQHLQEKYNKDLLEREKTQPPAAPAEPRQPAITNDLIARAYDKAATEIVNDLIAKNLMESDLPEAYPRAIQTLTGQLRYAFDVIFSNQEKLDRLIAETSGAKAQVQAQVVHNAYNQQLDALVAKDAKLYQGLKDPKTREGFTNFLIQEVGATVGQTTGEKAPTFLAKQWVAFNSDTVIAAAQNGTKQKAQAANKRFVVGEGTGSRPGVVDTGETTLLDRLTSSSGKIQE